MMSNRLFNQIPYRVRCDSSGWDGGARIVRLLGKQTQCAGVSPAHAHMKAEANAMVCRMVVEGRHQHGRAIASVHVMTWNKEYSICLKVDMQS